MPAGIARLENRLPIFKCFDYISGSGRGGGHQPLFVEIALHGGVIPQGAVAACDSRLVHQKISPSLPASTGSRETNTLEVSSPLKGACRHLEFPPVIEAPPGAHPIPVDNGSEMVLAAEGDPVAAALQIGEMNDIPARRLQRSRAWI